MNVVIINGNNNDYGVKPILLALKYLFDKEKVVYKFSKNICCNEINIVIDNFLDINFVDDLIKSKRNINTKVIIIATEFIIINNFSSNIINTYSSFAKFLFTKVNNSKSKKIIKLFIPSKLRYTIYGIIRQRALLENLKYIDHIICTHPAIEDGLKGVVGENILLGTLFPHVKILQEINKENIGYIAYGTRSISRIIKTYVYRLKIFIYLDNKNTFNYSIYTPKFRKIKYISPFSISDLINNHNVIIFTDIYCDSHPIVNVCININDLHTQESELIKRRNISIVNYNIISDSLNKTLINKLKNV
jgi:hypothetical protein